MRKGTISSLCWLRNIWAASKIEERVMRAAAQRTLGKAEWRGKGPITREGDRKLLIADRRYFVASFPELGDQHHCSLSASVQVVRECHFLSSSELTEVRWHVTCYPLFIAPHERFACCLACPWIYKGYHRWLHVEEVLIPERNTCTLC